VDIRAPVVVIEINLQLLRDKGGGLKMEYLYDPKRRYHRYNFKSAKQNGVHKLIALLEKPHFLRSGRHVSETQNFFLAVLIVTTATFQRDKRCGTV